MNIDRSMTRESSKMKILSLRLMMNFSTLNYNSKRNYLSKKTISGQSLKNWLIWELRLKEWLMSLVQKSLRLRFRGSLRKLSSLKKKIFILRQRSSLISIKSKRWKFLIRRIKDFRPRKTYRLSKRLRKEPSARSKAPWKTSTLMVQI